VDDIVFTKLDSSSGNYVVEFVYRVCALSQMPRGIHVYRKIYVAWIELTVVVVEVLGY